MTENKGKPSKKGRRQEESMDIMTMGMIEDLKRTLQEIKDVMIANGELLEEIRDILREES